MADSSSLTDEQREKQENVRQILAGLKTVADFTTNPQGRGALVQRVGSVAAAKGIEHLERTQAEASGLPKTAQSKYADWEPLAISAFIESHLGPEWITFEPDTIIDLLPLGAEEVARALCARQVLYDHGPFTDWHVFEKIAVAFNNRVPDFETTQDLNPSELAWAVTQMRRIDPSTPFSEEVKNYVAVLLRDAGIVVCPGALADCQPHLTYITSDHGCEVHTEVANEKNTPAAAHQVNIADTCAKYVAFKHQKLTKELEQV